MWAFGGGGNMTEAEWLSSTGPMPMLAFLRGQRVERLEPFFGRFARYVEFPERRTPEQAVRLFAVACCRRIAHLVSPDRVERAIQTFESLGGRLIEPLPADGCVKALDAAERFALDGAGDDEVAEGMRHALATRTLFDFFILSDDTANDPFDRNLLEAAAEAAEAIGYACDTDEGLDRVPGHAARAMSSFAASRRESAEEATRAESASQCRLLREMFNPFAAAP
jgi:hypothetical protein